MNATEPFVKCYFDTPVESLLLQRSSRGRSRTQEWVWYCFAHCSGYGHVEPGISSTKENWAEDSVRPALTEALTLLAS